MSDKEPAKSEEATAKEVETKETQEKEVATEEGQKKEAETEKAQKKEVKRQEAGPKEGKKQEVIFVGNRPPMNYVLAVITAFNLPDTSEVVLKARGRAITTAVDVAEITRNRFLKDAKIHAISIGSEEMESREGGNPRNVSTIEINLREQ